MTNVIISKVLELLILDYLIDYLYTEWNQCCFKMTCCTDMCVFMLKQFVDFYVRRGSPVYIVYLDVSKAFDRINVYCLCSKLLACNINVLFIRLLLYWYCN